MVGIEMPKEVTVREMVQHIREAIRTGRNKYNPNTLETPPRWHGVTVSPMRQNSPNKQS